MTFYQELQLSSTGSKELIKKEEDKKEKWRHILIYNVKVYLVVAFCFAVVTPVSYTHLAVQDSEIRRNTFQLVVILAVMEVILILSALFFILFMTRKLTKPVQDIGRVVEAVSEGNCQVRIAEIPEGDMGVLCDQVNDMIVKLDRLMTNNIEIERQKRIFEINYIQMQMNPHFLYNTLAVSYTHLDVYKRQTICWQYCTKINILRGRCRY